MVKDEEEAVKWYRKAADQGSTTARFSLGLMYEDGRGVVKDEAEAVKLYRIAAAEGYADAQHNLGVMYWLGNGVVKDEVAAYKWYLLAGAQGHELAKKKIPLIEKDLTGAQRAEGQRLAREWKPPVGVAVGPTPSGQTPAEAKPVASGSGCFQCGRLGWKR